MTSSMAERNVEVVGTALTLLSEDWRQALERYDEIATPEFEWHGGATGAEGPEADATYRGRKGFRRYWAEVDEAWGSQGFEIGEIRPVGEHVVLALGRSRVQGAHSGIEFDQELGLVWRMRDGLIAGGRTYVSHDEAERAAEEAAREPTEAESQSR